ncbi:MAG TPA: serine/threonine-protein kinase [Blastocatellia bacterium]|nr:serine/threonine-protein kinase [Blastocatellia bacterium]
MTPDRRQKIESIFQSALARAPAERAAFLDQACDGDPALREEIESLITADTEATRLMQAPDPHDQSAPLAGQRIGQYRIIRELGRGGMGKVMLAARPNGSKVALKLIRRGMDTEHIIRRFQNERQILAALDHPNIARLLDGGTTTDGAPYFVMEYIEGKPMIDYCDAQKLNITERLKLFCSVCAAVHYAHRKLIVHRDIKPGNILVTDEGELKLLDFGIAKLLRPDSPSPSVALTPPGVRLMTLDYASPEQVKAERVTPASDIYSLGVVLFELLTGHQPYRLSTRKPGELIRAICEQEPEAPSVAIVRIDEFLIPDSTNRIITPELVSSTREGKLDALRLRLSGDLDTIVLKALRKRPDERYRTVAEFSEEIRRHLEGSPAPPHKETSLSVPAITGARYDDALRTDDGLKTSVINVNDLRALLASGAEKPAQTDAEALRSALAYYQRCAEILQELRDRELLKGSDGESLNELLLSIAAQIARLNDAIAKSKT